MAAGLAGAVCVLPERASVQAGGRPGHDDRPAAAAQHRPDPMLARQKHPGQIDADDLGPDGEVEAIDRGITAVPGLDPRHAHHHIEPTPRLDECGHASFNVGLPGDIPREDEHLAPGVADAARDGLEELSPTTQESDPCTLAGEQQRRCRANPGARPGDECSFALQPAGARHADRRAGRMRAVPVRVWLGRHERRSAYPSSSTSTTPSIRRSRPATANGCSARPGACRPRGPIGPEDVHRLGERSAQGFERCRRLGLSNPVDPDQRPLEDRLEERPIASRCRRAPTDEVDGRRMRRQENRPHMPCANGARDASRDPSAPTLTGRRSETCANRAPPASARATTRPSWTSSSEPRG